MQPLTVMATFGKEMQSFTWSFLFVGCHDMYTTQVAEKSPSIRGTIVNFWSPSIWRLLVLKFKSLSSKSAIDGHFLVSSPSKSVNLANACDGLSVKSQPYSVSSWRTFSATPRAALTLWLGRTKFNARRIFLLQASFIEDCQHFSRTMMHSASYMTHIWRTVHQWWCIFHYPEKKLSQSLYLFLAYLLNPTLSIPPIYPIPPFSSHPFKYSRQLINPWVPRGPTKNPQTGFNWLYWLNL